MRGPTKGAARTLLLAKMKMHLQETHLTNFPPDVNELKVFVDLASISAGENDMDVDRVACFHDAVLGYSSLLYELKRESGFDDFMQCLKKLGKALESDENLPKKLVRSAVPTPPLTSSPSCFPMGPDG